MYIDVSSRSFQHYNYTPSFLWTSRPFVQYNSDLPSFVISHSKEGKMSHLTTKRCDFSKLENHQWLPALFFWSITGNLKKGVNWTLQLVRQLPSQFLSHSRAGFEVCRLGMTRAGHESLNHELMYPPVKGWLRVVSRKPKSFVGCTCLYGLYSHLLQLRKRTTIIGGHMGHFFNVSVPFSSRAGIVRSVSSLPTRFWGGTSFTTAGGLCSWTKAAL